MYVRREHDKESGDADAAEDSQINIHPAVDHRLKERVKKLKKEHGSVELGKITADMVLGGMRGMTTLVWLGSAVDPDEISLNTSLYNDVHVLCLLRRFQRVPKRVQFGSSLKNQTTKFQHFMRIFTKRKPLLFRPCKVCYPRMTRIIETAKFQKNKNGEHNELTSGHQNLVEE